MRINPNVTADLLASLANAQEEQNKAMLQMASGRRVNTPSDDPSAAAILVQNQAQSSQADQFLRSADSVQAQLQTTDSTLNSVVLALQRAISLGVQGANGTLSDANRASVVGELNGIQDQLIGLANLSFQGQFVFAGTATQAQPFVADATQPSGVRYDGNAGTNSVAVGDGVSMQVNVPGSQIFAATGSDMFQAVHDLITALQSNTGIDTAVTGVRAAFDHVTAQRVFYGNAMNQLQSQQTYLNNDKLLLSQQENAVGGADLAAATTNLLSAQNARSAALAAAGKISQLSLFDYLNY
ncbi:MAG: flagellar hook-associated protein 3 [Acidobacteria bacterium]|nr:MAG: flagellar hook-associated protein 3 [Acidobacteriota bacterium]PYX47945.1 MAG: flagellar hook-associated protein 3 [Acidobacteriota bacterium]